MILTVFQIVSLLGQVYIAFTRKKRNVLIATFLINLAQTVCYFIVSDTAAFYISIVITVRTFVYIFSERLKRHRWSVVIPIAAIAVHLAVGVMSIETPLQLITMLTPCFTCYYLWFFRDTQRIRVGNIVGNALWLVYNCLGGLWILALTRVWTIALNAAAYLRYRRQAAPLPRPRAQTH